MSALMMMFLFKGCNNLVWFDSCQNGDQQQANIRVEAGLPEQPKTAISVSRFVFFLKSLFTDTMSFSLVG